MSSDRRLVKAFFFVAAIALMSSSSVLGSVLSNQTSSLHECRLWGIASSSIPHDVVLDELVRLPNSLKSLGASNPNGWGLGYYNGFQPIVLRGQLPANTDPNFDAAAEQVAESGAQIALGHVRRASSGLTNIPDPHPFQRSDNNAIWLFCHNGGIDKSILINLIGSQYLASHQPTVGSNQAQWIDSELYFIYILKCCEQSNWNIEQGISTAVVNICNSVSGTSETLNFLLTNGQTLWGFRKGNTLYYYNGSQYTTIASQYPGSSQGSWITISDYYLVTLAPGYAPLTKRICYSVTIYVKDASTGKALSSATVYLDNTYAGTTDSYGKSYLQAATPGQHTIKIAKPGYFTGTVVISLSLDATVTVRLNKT